MFQDLRTDISIKTGKTYLPEIILKQYRVRSIPKSSWPTESGFNILQLAALCCKENGALEHITLLAMERSDQPRSIPNPSHNGRQLHNVTSHGPRHLTTRTRFVESRPNFCHTNGIRGSACPEFQPVEGESVFGAGFLEEITIPCSCRVIPGGVLAPQGIEDGRLTGQLTCRLPKMVSVLVLR